MTRETGSEISSMLNDLANSLGDESIIAIVDAFRDVSHKQINLMEEAVTASNRDQLRAQAHSLKSSAANLGATQLSELCAKLEKADSITPAIAEMVEQAKLSQTLALECMLNWRATRA